MLALRADGTVVAWNIEDFDDFGQSEVPAALTDVVAIAAEPYHSLAVRADRTVIAWGPGRDAAREQCRPESDEPHAAPGELMFRYHDDAG